MKNNRPRILLIDIETSPLEVYTWGIGDQFIAINQIIKDWSILSFAAQWIDETDVIYMDTRKQKNKRDDKKIVKKMCELLDEADYVVTHYGSKFDIPKIDTRRLKHKFPVFKIPKHEDTKTMANKFAFTSNKLEYIAKFLDVKHKKLVEKRQFVGMDLWRECLDSNSTAWAEMKKYNIQDILVLKDVYDRLKPRGSKVNYSLFSEAKEHICVCGSTEFKENGHDYQRTGKFKRYKCKKCGTPWRSTINLMDKEKKKSIMVKI